MENCCGKVVDGNYYQAETKSGEKWTPAFIDHVDENKCAGCGMCVKVCSRNVYEILEIDNKKISVTINAGNCVGDGSCHMVCKSNAIICFPKKK
jgi:NAD-dependent dihydropyrimidine dehydrogenase PreA subunit